MYAYILYTHIYLKVKLSFAEMEQCAPIFAKAFSKYLSYDDQQSKMYKV